MNIVYVYVSSVVFILLITGTYGAGIKNGYAECSNDLPSVEEYNIYE